MSETEQRSWPRRLLNRLEINRAVFYALSMRAWQFVAGPVTMVLIAAFFTPEVQGYFYTFASLIALQSFFEMSMNVAITNVASHEWARLDLDEEGRIAGDPESLSRLRSLGRSVFAWYGVVAGLFVAVIGTGGAFFFAEKPGEVVWQMPWGVVVALSGVSLWLVPASVLLRGCNQVTPVNRYRVLQSITGNLAVWTCIPLGAGLWTSVAIAAVKLFWDAYPLLIPYRRFFRTLLAPPSGPRIDWRAEVLPFWGRVGIDGMLGSLVFALFTPVMFHYHGPAMAGRMGMTWTALNALGWGALAWMQARVPQFGILVFRRDFAELDRMFARLLAVSVTALAAGGAAFWSVVELLNVFEHPFAERFLAPLPTALLLGAVLLYHVPRCQKLYVRAHKREPFLTLSVISHVAAALLIWQLGSRFGPRGATAAYLAVIALWTLPTFMYVWLRFRRERGGSPGGGVES